MKEPNLSGASLQHFLGIRGWIEIPSSGTSMYPLIKHGDVCRFIPIDHEKGLNKMDIILFQTDQGHLVGHRYQEHYTEDETLYYIFKGDTNVCPDPPIRKTQIIGQLSIIKKRNFQIQAKGIVSRLWGAVVLAFPVLPRYCKRCLLLKSKITMRGKESHHA